MSLQELAEALPSMLRKVVGDGQVQITGVQHDSRLVGPGDLFFALGGQVFDGADYTADAIARGAVAIAAEQVLQVDVPQVQVNHGLLALAHAARLVYGDPTRGLRVAGVTGTNGKTTVAHLVEQALLALGERPGLAGTVTVRGPGGDRAPTHTTPMADELMRIARWLVDSGATHFVMEASSHGMAMHRVDGVRFDVAAFTNLSQDHLDFHGDLISYGAAKARLFTELKPRVAVINLDDEFGRQLSRRVESQRPGTSLRYSARGDRDAELSVIQVAQGRAGLQATIETPEGAVDLQSPLLGMHNLENLTCALGICMGLGFPAEDAARALGSASGAPGRLERVPHPEDVLVFVDYAHTPDALERVCTLLKESTAGRLLVLFGCGGDRDRTKRPLMGEVVGRFAEIAFLTSDNPRGESPSAIIDDIVPGLLRAGVTALSVDALSQVKARGFLVEPDRGLAIGLALQAARPGDTVLIAGKGHEKVQIVGTERLAFDDVEEAAKAIARTREGA